ncbi:MAG: UvrD-helicase domain-containing protein [Bacteroidetes bacterium]|nr:UvrD-helicase domain-containing protein [Bacteroidota bacterium]MCL1969518.1 UvrD-helicase domain-containing protein [Bacteroidota bacterium]MCL1969680.1 UvrD-helicase domain-containing protein [Bacteroidota bacterium]
MFTLFKASAGSGKTSRLVVEYLSLCLPQPEKFKHVLAVTFTNNATAEMKSRIVDTLSQFAFETEITPDSSVFHTYNQIIAKIAPHLPENEQFDYIKKQSKILLEKILYEYDRFSISTIDSFFQRILRAFALEFGLNTQFNLEIETDDFFQETITVLLNRISKNNTEITDRVLDLVKNLMLDKGKWKIEKELLRLLDMSMEEEVYLPLKRLKESENKNFEQAKKKMNQEVARLKALKKNFTTKEEKKSEAYIQLNEELKEVEFFKKNLFQLALLFDLKMIMDEIKVQDNRFYLSETNALVNEKISKEEDVPFIYEKIGNQYSYFFIDEFQDTSKLQWENMIPLIKNALSGNNRFNEQGKVFLFGDVKQAIYRFRNGDADILQKLSKIEGYRDAVLPYATQDKDYRVELLDTNYRSTKNVVTFNNEFFNYLTDTGAPFQDAKDFYEDVKQKTKPNAKEGVVTIRFQEEDDPVPFKEFVLEPVLETVCDALQRGYDYKDIAVLVSGNDLAGNTGSFLIANDIPIISVQSLQLSESPEVNVIIATLKYLVSEEDKLAKLSIIHYLTQKNNLLLEDKIKYLHSEQLMQQFLSDHNIDINKKQLVALPLFTLLNEIYRIYSFAIDNPFLTRLLDEAENFITKNCGTVSLFLEWWEEKGSKMALSTPSGINAVTVSTIHKSKGLEYPVVILPFSRYDSFSTKPNILIQDNEHVTGLEYDWVTLTDKTPVRFYYKYEEERKKTLIDKLNRLYVAHTRAGNELHIITEKENKGNYSKFLKEYGERFAVSGEQKTEGRKQKAEKEEETTLGHHIITSPHHHIITSSRRSPQAEYGLFIHNFLSSLTSFPQNDKEIELAVQNVEETYRAHLVTIFNKILNDKLLAPYFAPNIKVLNETSILFPDGNLLRPDRVVFLGDKVVIIDYKTGETTASHKEQIDRYCDAIREMGFEKVEGCVLYI